MGFATWPLEFSSCCRCLVGSMEFPTQMKINNYFYKFLCLPKKIVFPLEIDTIYEQISP